VGLRRSGSLPDHSPVLLQRARFVPSGVEAARRPGAE
jgi:hypothetical protein